MAITVANRWVMDRVFKRPSGGDAQFWLNLQQDHDLKLAERAVSKIIEAEVSPFETSLPAKVERALEGRINPDDLSTDEQELYLEKLGESYRVPSPIEDKFFADLRARGGAVGMDEAGNIVVSEASKSNAL